MHYVPLTYSTADLIEKIEWLRANDGMARQLADNARNFGASYLRMEDHFCYAAAALQMVAEVENCTDVLRPFVFTNGGGGGGGGGDRAPSPATVQQKVARRNDSRRFIFWRR